MSAPRLHVVAEQFCCQRRLDESFVRSFSLLEEHETPALVVVWSLELSTLRITERDTAHTERMLVLTLHLWKAVWLQLLYLKLRKECLLAHHASHTRKHTTHQHAYFAHGSCGCSRSSTGKHNGSD